jgi:hypothetical protein
MYEDAAAGVYRICEEADTAVYVLCKSDEAKLHGFYKITVTGLTMCAIHRHRFDEYNV